MNLERLKSAYSNSINTIKLKEVLNNKKSIIHLKGLVGSIDALISYSLCNVLPSSYLYILRDKEESAYFYNNLENIINKEKGITTLFYPASYKRPYQIEDIDNANIILRTEVLDIIRKKRKNTLIVTYPEAIIENVVTRREFEKNILELQIGIEYEIDFINELLIEHNFDKVDYVYEPGQFAVRGDIVDIYSFSNEKPYRLEFFGDELESIRIFNPDDQLSIKTVKKITVVPNVNNNKLIEENRTSFLSYIQKDTKIWIKDFDYAKHKILKGFDKANYIYNQIDSPINRLSPSQLYISPLDFEKQLLKHSIIEFGERFNFTPNLTINYKVKPQPPFNKNFNLLIDSLNKNVDDNYVNIILSDSSIQLNRLNKIFEDMGEEVKYQPIQMSIHEGFIDKELKIACYTDHQIFERYHRFKLKEGYKKSKQALTIKELYNLQKGDFVVHIDHGVGEFSGLEKIDTNGKKQEAIRLIYKGGDILYVSIHSLHRISKFTGKDGKQPTLNKLGSPAWNSAKNKTKSKIKKIAFDLIKLYAKRKASKGFSFSPDTYLQNELEASFIYEDTPDQLATTVAVKEDMESEHPMDRLVCGDVGFGKTEIAIRAAFKAVADNKQVAILVPTTVLAYQHYKTFSERLKDFPCSVDYVNRFKSNKENKETLKKLKEGSLDIIIGTHRLTGKDILFKDLGLLIIDEEQKFGVSVKDKLKTLKNNVDTLTLTATPIPRTLQFSMMNARDLSVINTPPQNRFPIETIVQPFNETTIRDAIIYETQRGGQVYFIHNRVQNIKEIAGMIQRLCPDIKLAIGHGQMDGKQLEAIIMDFMSGIYDVLVATSIVESGIDVSNANTIIINNANSFGLSDLHQLRGRVGRSNKKAFAYLFTPPPQHLTEDARKRLTAIEQFSDLGSGMSIAMRDLDIRGAGDLLGANQSGFINEIGFNTFQKILDEAILELKNNEFKDVFKEELKEKDFVSECVIETDLNLVIPDSYVNEITERLSLYRELDNSKNEEDITVFSNKLEDRFGKIPKETKELINTVRLRWLAKNVGFIKIVIKNNIMIGYFIEDQQSEYFQSNKFSNILSYIQNNSKTCSISERNEKLKMRFNDIKSIKDAKDVLKVMV